MLAYLGAGLLAGVVALLASRSIWPGVIGFLVASVWAYLEMPVIAWGFYALPYYVLFGAILGFAWVLLAGDSYNRDKGKVGQASLVLAAGIILTFILPFFTTSAVFHASAYRSLLGPVDTVQNSPDLAPMDPAKVRIVDGALAAILAERVLGNEGALGSQVDIGAMELQVIGGEWYWAAPLNHAGFWRWLDSDGTPGYVLVSAVDSRDVKLVTEVAGKPLSLKYNPGSFFGEDPVRYLYQHGYARRGVTNYAFEVNDEGEPFIVATEFRRRVGFSGEEPVAGILLNMQTGEHSRCLIKDCPAWVDLIQPEGMALTQVNDWGGYVHGWWNPSGREKLASTGEMARVLDSEGHQHYYTGITSVNADKGTTGYMLVNTRTGEASYHLQAGATEHAAMASAQGAVQDQEYVAVYPTPYNIGGVWSYLVPLKDDAGFVKNVAFVSVQNDQILGVGEDARAALRKYRQVLATRGGAVAADAATRHARVEGRLLRLGVDSRAGDTYYYLWIEGHENIAFVGGGSLSAELPLTREGDLVRVDFEESGQGVVDLSGFDNQGLTFRSTTAESAVATRDSTVRASAAVARDAQEADARWEGMSEAEKARILAASEGDSASVR